MPWVQNIIGGVLAGLITAALILVVQWFRKRVVRRRFRAFFGSDAADSDVLLVVPELYSTSPGAVAKNRRTGKEYGIQEFVARHDAKAAAYVAAKLGECTPGEITIVTDDELGSRLDCSMITLGLESNSKTLIDVLENPAYCGPTLVELANLEYSPLRKTSNQTRESHFFGVIVKIYPEQFPNRVWFACAGLNRYGTSAAGWYLAHKWRELLNRVGSDPFIATLKVHRQQGDESTQLLDVQPLLVR